MDIYFPIKQDKKDTFIQEELRIELPYPMEPPEKEKPKEETQERGVIIIQL